jgi:hypothetical protein
LSRVEVDYRVANATRDQNEMRPPSLLFYALSSGFSFCFFCCVLSLCINNILDHSKKNKREREREKMSFSLSHINPSYNEDRLNEIGAF